MSEPFLAQITQFGGTFAPRGWALCDGQILPINNYQSLYSLLGTTYGGDGRTTFGLPDLRGRNMAHPGSAAGASLTLGQKTGTVTVATSQMPAHNHATSVSTANASAGSGTAAVPAVVLDSSNNPYNVYRTGAGNAAGDPTGANAGGGGQFRNPYTAVNHIIALQGTFPSRN